MHLQDASAPGDNLDDWGYTELGDEFVSGNNVLSRWKKRILCSLGISLTCLICFAGLIAVLLLVSYFAIVPAIVSDFTKNTHIYFTQVNVSDPVMIPAHKQVGGVVATLNMSVAGHIDTGNAATLPATIDGFDMYIKVNDTVVGYASVPDTKVSGETSKFHNHNIMHVTNLSAWNALNSELVRRPSIHIVAEGKTHLRVGGLSWPTKPVNHMVEPGFDGISHNISVVSLSMANSTQQAVVVDSVVRVFNPTYLSVLPIGYVTSELYFQGTHIGHSTSTHPVNVHPGYSEIHLRGTFTPKNMTAASILTSRYLSGLNTSIKSIGPPNATSIPFFAPPVAGLVIDTVFPGTTERLVQDINFTSMDLTPTGPRTILVNSSQILRVWQMLGPHVALDISGSLFSNTFLYHGEPIGVATGPRVVPRVNGTSPYVGIDLCATLSLSGDSGEDRWVDFLTDFTYNDSVTVELDGTVVEMNVSGPAGNLTLRDVPTPIRAKQVGLGGLAEAHISHFMFHGFQPDGSLLLASNISVYNPSVSTARFGTIHMAVYTEGAHLGTVSYDDVLVPGWNVISATTRLHPSVEDLPAVANQMNRFLTHRNSTITSVGLNVTGPYADVPWVQRFVRRLRLNTTLPPYPDPNGLLGPLRLENISAVFTRNAQVLLSGHSVGQLYNPYNFPFNLTQVSLDVTNLYEGWPIAHVDLPITNVTYTPANGTVVTPYHMVPQDVANASAFGRFTTDSLHATSLNLVLNGTVTHATLVNQQGPLHLSGQAFNHTVAIKGCGGFMNPPPLIEDIDTVGAFQTGLRLRSVVQITNPGTAALLVEDPITLFLYTPGGVPIGNTTMSNRWLYRGTNTFHNVSGYFQMAPGPLKAASLQYIANYAMGIPQSVRAIGTNESTSAVLLQQAVASLNLTLRVAGNTPLLREVNITGVSLYNEYVDISIKLANPWMVDVVLEHQMFDITLSSNNDSIGVINTTNPIRIPPGKSLWSRPVKVHITDWVDNIEALLQIIEHGGVTKMSAYGQLSLSLLDPTAPDSFDFSIPYHQEKIPTVLYGV